MGKKNEVDEVTDRAISNGGVLAKLYFDMQSEKTEDLQPLMTEMINNQLMKSPGIIYCYGAIDEPIKLGEVYSTSAIVTVLTKDLGALVNVVFHYIPAGVEILKPQGKYELRTANLQSILLDIANLSVEYYKYLMDKVMTKEDFAKVSEVLKKREELGRKLIEKKEDKK